MLETIIAIITTVLTGLFAFLTFILYQLFKGMR